MKDFKKTSTNKSSKAVENRRTNKWRTTSERIRLKYHYMCQNPKTNCQAIAKEVHHILPACSYPQFFFDEWNLIPLCQQCHDKLGLLQGAERNELLNQWRRIHKQTTDHGFS